MEILVKVFAEDTRSDKTRLANEAFFTFVALDDEGSPCFVPSLTICNDAEGQLFQEAKIRRKIRLDRKKSAE
jgi:acyl-CoA hydrolase